MKSFLRCYFVSFDRDNGGNNVYSNITVYNIIGIYSTDMHIKYVLYTQKNNSVQKYNY